MLNIILSVLAAIGVTTGIAAVVWLLLSTKKTATNYSAVARRLP